MLRRTAVATAIATVLTGGAGVYAASHIGDPPPPTSYVAPATTVALPPSTTPAPALVRRFAPADDVVVVTAPAVESARNVHEGSGAP